MKHEWIDKRSTGDGMTYKVNKSVLIQKYGPSALTRLLPILMLQKNVIYNFTLKDIHNA